MFICLSGFNRLACRLFVIQHLCVSPLEFVVALFPYLVKLCFIPFREEDISREVDWSSR